MTTGHSPFDDRIYYKEALSLSRRFSSIIIIAPKSDTDRVADVGSIKIFPLKSANSAMQRILNIPAAIRAVMKLKPAVCHFHDYEFIFALPFLRLFTNCKFIYDVHEANPEMVEQSRKIPRLLRPLLSKLVRTSEYILSHLTDYIITCDSNVAKQFKHIPKVEVIFNYPRSSIFIPDQKRLSELKKRYAGKVPIIYQGGMSEDRGLFKMIDALNIIKDSRPDILLLLVGEMSEHLYKRSRELISSYDLSGSVDLVGGIPHEDIVNYISISKIGLVPLLPTKKFLKNIPIKQFEYMACGIPVLGGDLPPTSSYITSASCGRIFNSNSSESMASNILEMLNNESELQRMSEAGKKAVTNDWNWDRMEEKLLAVYDDMLKRT